MRSIIPPRDRIQLFANLMDMTYPLCVVGLKDNVHIMSQCELTRILWFKLLGIHLHAISFSSPLDYFATVTYVTNKFGHISG